MLRPTLGRFAFCYIGQPMKHAKNLGILFILEFLICYFAGAFYSVSFSIAEWEPSVRGGVLAAFAGTYCVSALVYGMIQDVR
jgi:hypothetical protein